ncbi:unnamed protein product [Somion occarium]|uniref:SAC3/GANP/THP3 conserved domain-containing protein n=1 Tax=Somion occarium TaxID=3059160 RepID=A0ABP1D1T0_9APHY
MEAPQTRGRGLKVNGATPRPHPRNKQWIAGQDNTGHGSDGERWERGGTLRRGRGRGRGSTHVSPRLVATALPTDDDVASGTDGEAYEDMETLQADNVVMKDETQNEAPDDPQARERFWQELVKAREIERRAAIAEGKMDDPSVSKRLDEAITMVGTCMDMCPRFERYRRERENNLDKWEVIPGTKRVDHKRAVKIYERAAGDKTMPSDLRPPEVLKKTLDYLFHDLINKGFSETYGFIRDRSRAVRSDFTMQHETGPLAIECHDRCARFHILALHLERDNPGFSIELEEQQLMNTLQSLKEFYEDQRGRYSAPTELEMRVYHRLIHIRDQRERHEDIPEEITSHPVFQLTTKFRLHVQAKSAPISKKSPLIVDAAGMQIFAELAAHLREQNNVVMIYLVACIMERLFGKDTIEDIETIRGDLTISEIIDGISRPLVTSPEPEMPPALNGQAALPPPTTAPVTRSATEWLSINFGPKPTTSTFFAAPETTQPINGFASTTPAPSQPVQSAFSNLGTSTNAFGQVTSVFGGPTFGTEAASSFGPNAAQTSAFGFGTTQSAFAPAKPEPPPSQPSQPLPPIFSSPFPQATPATNGASHPGGIFSAALTASTFSIPAPPSGQPTLSTKYLNPSAPSFTPGPSFASLPVTVSPSPPAQQPSLLSQATPPQVDVVKPQVPSSTRYVSPFEAPSIPPAPTSFARSPPKLPSPETKPAPETPEPKFVERQQTLWDFPSTPSPSRTPAPPQLRVPIPTSTPELTTPPSPREPPPVKVHHMALPPTPTTRWFDPTSGQIGVDNFASQKRKSVVNLPHLQMPQMAGSPTEMLSPLQMAAPGMLKTPSPSLQPRPTEALASTSRLPPGSIKKPNGIPSVKGKERQTSEDLRGMAVNFARRSPLIKHSFERWMQKTMDRLAYAEALRRSEAYKERLQRERLSSSMGSTSGRGRRTSPPKRRMSVDGFTEMIQSMRKKRRISTESHAPLNDELLAQRLQETQEEHQKRWAQGSFLHAIRSHVANVSPDSQVLSGMDIWLALNTGNDSTAIWLEQKFAVPISGRFLSENVFSIPVVPNSLSTSSSPVLIVFERTPASDVDDPLERKYRVIDDCARLRDVMQGLHNSDMRFRPTLLIIQWSDGVDSDEASDFTEMELRNESILEGFHTFSISAEDKDLDERLQKTLARVKLDVNDTMSQVLSWTELADVFVELFRQYASDWLDSCWSDDQFDWQRYDDVIRAIEDAQIMVVQAILSILHVSSPVRKIDRPDDLKGPAQLGHDYAVGLFIDTLAKSIVHTAKTHIGQSLQENYRLQRNGILRARDRTKQALEGLSSRLRELAATRAMSAPEYEDGTNWSDISVSPESEHESFGRTTSMSALSDESVPVTDETTSQSRASPAFSEESNGTTKPGVTVAMLRALAQGVLKAKT